MSRPGSLARRLGLALFGYAMLLSLVVFVYGHLVNEAAERLVWTSLLNAEMDHLMERRASDESFQWRDTETLTLAEFPINGHDDQALARLGPGIHDEVTHLGQTVVVNVRDIGESRFVLALDISELERQERGMAWSILGTSAVLAAFMALLVAWGAHRLVDPLVRLAERIRLLEPDNTRARIEPPAHSTSEILVIVGAVNGYLERHTAFVEREHAFIDSVSHELRTPVAVITGAAELALSQRGLVASVDHQLRRILNVAQGVDQLISLLLVLAKAPERLASMSDGVALHQLLPEILEDHRHLCEGKSLTLCLAPLPRDGDIIVAPLMIVQAAIGNLLRNAIENSDNGQIRVGLEEGPTVVIEDPGHGMSPEEISQLYRRLVQGQSRDRGGLGLALIARLCAHLGWQLAVERTDTDGTRVRLDLSRSRASTSG